LSKSSRKTFVLPIFIGAAITNPGGQSAEFKKFEFSSVPSFPLAPHVRTPDSERVIKELGYDWRGLFYFIFFECYYYLNAILNNLYVC